MTATLTRNGNGNSDFAALIESTSEQIGFEAGDANVRRYVGNQTTLLTDPSGLSPAFWKGAIAIAEAQKVPLALLKWNLNNKITVALGENCAYSPLYDTVYITDFLLRRCQRIGGTGLAANDVKTGIGIIVNEAFHSWFDHEGKKLDWLKPIINAQTQFKTDIKTKAEEAMSETLQKVIDTIASGGKLPTYKEIVSGAAGKQWEVAITPMHNEEGQIWEGDATANLPMTEDLYYATIFIAYHAGSSVIPTQFAHPISKGLKSFFYQLTGNAP